jgi:hypothetical protein
MRARFFLSALALLVEICGTQACSSSDSKVTNTVCSELYGRGLTGCTEHCRPFGVLDFGVIVLPDGTVAWICECLPGPALGEGEPKPEEGDPDGEPPKSLVPPGRQAEVAAFDRARDGSSVRPPSTGDNSTFDAH